MNRRMYKIKLTKKEKKFKKKKNVCKSLKN